MDQLLGLGTRPARGGEVLEGLAELRSDGEDHVGVEVGGGTPRERHADRLRVVLGEGPRAPGVDMTSAPVCSRQGQQFGGGVAAMYTVARE